MDNSYMLNDGTHGTILSLSLWIDKYQNQKNFILQERRRPYMQDGRFGLVEQMVPVRYTQARGNTLIFFVFVFRLLVE